MTGTKTGLVLIHGSELGAWLWTRVLSELESPALAVDLPGRGQHAADRRSVRLSDAVSSVVEDVDEAGFGQTVIVAHSFSGVLVPAIAQRLGDRVAGIVLVGASVPRPGTSWVGLLPLPQRLLLRSLYTVRPAGLLSPEAENRKTLCNDLDDETTAWFLSQRVPEAPRLLLDPVPSAKFPKDTPLHYVRLLGDRSITDHARDRMIGDLPKVQLHDMDTGHLPMLSKPAALALLLDGIGGR